MSKGTVRKEMISWCIKKSTNCADSRCLSCPSPSPLLDTRQGFKELDDFAFNTSSLGAGVSVSSWFFLDSWTQKDFRSWSISALLFRVLG